ncbi:MAG: hypothetical protein KDB28_14325 [Tetrasphaera sp.]|nr:hypothetical protein [Tetrasphaera sp.]
MARGVARVGTDDLTVAARAVAGYGPTVVVKDGGRGALALYRGEVLHEPGMLLHPVDTTGAGDTLDAGFIAALLAVLTTPAASPATPTAPGSPS